MKAAEAPRAASGVCPFVAAVDRGRDRRRWRCRQGPEARRARGSGACGSRMSAAKPAWTSATSTARAPTNTWSKPWARAGCSSTTTTTAGSTSSSSTADRSPIRRSRSRRGTACTGTAATARSRTSTARVRHPAIASTAWAPAPATTTTTAGSISTSPTSARTSLYRNGGNGRFTRRHRARRASRSRRCGARAARSPISTGTATSTCSSPTTWTPTRRTTPSAATRRLRIARLLSPAQLRAAAERRSTATTATASSPTSAHSPASARYRGNGLGVVIADFDDDGWPDVFVANDSVPNFLFHNTGAWRFAEVALRAGVAVATDGKARAGMGTDAGDYDGDGRLDLVVTNLDFEMHSLFRNLGDGLFAYATPESGIGPSTLPFVGFGVVFFDFDNDMQLDLAIANGHVMDNAAAVSRRARPTRSASCCSATSTPRPLHRDRPQRRAGLRAGKGRAAGSSSGDIDNDGDLDLLVTNNGQTADLLRNDGGSGNNALLVRTIGKQSNRDGIGAQLRLTAGNTHAGSRGEGRIELPWPERPAPALRARDGDPGRSTRGAVAKRANRAAPERGGEPDHHDPGGRRHRWPGPVRAFDPAGPSPIKALARAAPGASRDLRRRRRASCDLSPSRPPPTGPAPARAEPFSRRRHRPHRVR